MNNIYYLMWADAINSFWKYNPHKSNWKFTLFVYITWMNALNLWVVILWLKYFKVFDIPKVSIDVFPGTLLDSFFTFAFEFALPFAILNYLLIFYKNKYEVIVEKYKRINVKYALIYSFFSAILAFVSAILHGMLCNPSKISDCVKGENS